MTVYTTEFDKYLFTNYTYFSVLRFEEPFDSTIYCVKSDRNHALLAGTAQHGMTRLWDKRMIQPIQV